MTYNGETFCFDNIETIKNLVKDFQNYVEVLEKKGPEGVLPKIKIEPNGRDQILKFPGYVEPRHSLLTPSNPKDPCLNAKIQRPFNSGNRIRIHFLLRRKANLRGGFLFIGCECLKTNGLQDHCQRRECRGKPGCKTKSPGPVCGPSRSPKPTWCF